VGISAAVFFTAHLGSLFDDSAVPFLAVMFWIFDAAFWGAAIAVVAAFWFQRVNLVPTR
jgi:hypothetical protein